MSIPVSIDKAGRVVIPKPERERFHAGDELELDAAMVLRPVRQETPLRKEHGIWVARSAAPVKIDQLLDEIRDRRDADL